MRDENSIYIGLVACVAIVAIFVLVLMNVSTLSVPTAGSSLGSDQAGKAVEVLSQSAENTASASYRAYLDKKGIMNVASSDIFDIGMQYYLYLSTSSTSCSDSDGFSPLTPGSSTVGNEVIKEGLYQEAAGNVVLEQACSQNTLVRIPVECICGVGSRNNAYFCRSC